MLGGAAAMAAGHVRAAAPLRIGVLADLAGGQTFGLGAVAAARIAAEEVGTGAVGRTIEVLSADPGGDADFGATIVRNWITADGVEAIAAVVDDRVALAIQAVCRREGRVALLVGPTGRALSGPACSATGFQWLADTRAIAGAMLAALGNADIRAAHIVAAAEPEGQELAAELTAAFARSGIAPRGPADAPAIMLCGRHPGSAIVEALRQPNRPMVMASRMSLSMVRDLGQPALAGALAPLPFYWDTQETGRFWSRRFCPCRPLPTLPCRDFATSSGATAAASGWPCSTPRAAAISPIVATSASRCAAPSSSWPPRSCWPV